jgi:hypothetical protein
MYSTGETLGWVELDTAAYSQLPVTLVVWEGTPPPPQATARADYAMSAPTVWKKCEEHGLVLTTCSV